MPVELAVLCTDLKKTYPSKPPVDAVRGINLAVRRGECFGVLGPNGAGKTTTIEILEGLMKPTSGEVQVLGMTWNQQASEIRQRIGASLQETVLSDKITVRETLRLFRSFYRDGITVDDALDAVSLYEKADSWVKKLSGGQKQRLAVATALMGDPELLFLDEPTTGLDPTSRREVWQIIRSFQEEGRTILITTHYMDEAERLCDRVAIIDCGKVIAEDTPAALIASLGSNHIIEFELRDGESVATEDWLDRLSSVTESQFIEGKYRLQVSEPHRVIPELIRELMRNSQDLSSLTTRHASLEDVFVHLTGRSLANSEPLIQEN